MNPPICAHCGYDLAGLWPSDCRPLLCPECGTHIPLVQTATPRPPQPTRITSIPRIVLMTGGSMFLVGTLCTIVMYTVGGLLILASTLVLVPLIIGQHYLDLAPTRHHTRTSIAILSGVIGGLGCAVALSAFVSSLVYP